MSLSPTSVSSTVGVQPFHGYVETTADALCIIEAARRGHLPRITRRLNELERRSMIRSGAVFVFSVEESGIKRWTEGLAWSQSRISGNFLVYREVTDRSAIRSPIDTHEARQAAHAAEGHGTLKPNGLVKKTITVKIDGSDHHLISYFTQEDIRSGRLQRPTTRPDLRAIEIPQELLQSTTFRYPLKLEPRYGGNLTHSDDADEMDNQGGGGFSPSSVSSRTSERFIGRQDEDSASLAAGEPLAFSRSLSDSADMPNNPHSIYQGSTYPSYLIAPSQPSWPPAGDHGSHQSFSTASAVYHGSSSDQSHTTYPSGEGIWAHQQPSPSGLERGLAQNVAQQSVGGHIDSSSWTPYNVVQPLASTSSAITTSSLPTARREHTRNRSYPSVDWTQPPAAVQYQYPSTGHQYQQDQASSAGASNTAAGGHSSRDPTYHQPR
ncbi:Gti1/Pac2 family-domain-containing protein [Amylocystis lapponica]|nr:Gti1/Pac2 family-domain-containing protein [Amylocystis lapponica]